ncbi:RNA chaperone Hfq [Paraburkholderia sp. GAS334]
MAARPCVQDNFLHTLVKDKTAVHVFLVNGIRLSGQLGGFDQFAVLLESGPGAQLVFKHAISTARLAAEQSIAALRNAYNSLTPREQQIMSFVVAGLMNKQITSEMNLSKITVKIHRGQAMKKMSARSVAELVRKAEALRIRPQSM